MMKNVAVIGAGGWGSALALVLADNHAKVSLWAHDPIVAQEINETHSNSAFLPEISLPKSIKATNDVEEAAAGADIFVLAVPTQFIRDALRDFVPLLAGKPLVSGAKGIEIGTLMRVSEIVEDCAGIPSNLFAALTGPSHAEEVAHRKPTAVAVASGNNRLAHDVQQLFSTPNFRVYTSDDVCGCEIGGALKNVVAIAAGTLDGLKTGDNAKAALVTRGLAEMVRLGIAHGANPLTFSGLSGLGDLYVTCSSPHSRNRRVGEQLAAGKTLADILSATQMVAEGVATTKSVHQLLQNIPVDMPIASQMYDILFENKTPRLAIEELMTRTNKPEIWE